MLNKINTLYEEEEDKKKILEQKALNRTFIGVWLASFLFIFIAVGTLGIYLYSKNEVTLATSEYASVYNPLKANRTEEVDSEVKKLITEIGNSSNLVYNLSLFHTSPVEIIDLVEQAIYLGPDKIVTDENINFKNYTEISFGLITQDLENYATLIKKLKKLYSDTFEIKGLQDFKIEYEEDKKGRLTGKIFYTTKISLDYLNDAGKNLQTKGIFDDGTTEDIGKYENNELAYETFKTLLENFANKRKELGKKELYPNSKTGDDSIYLGTDIGYKDNNLYYITISNPVTDLFDFNGIGEKEDYEAIRQDNVKLLMLTAGDGTSYGLCTKVPKTEEELTDLEKESKDRTQYTKILSSGKINKTITDLCELL